jgi:hypothetical protein
VLLGEDLDVLTRRCASLLRISLHLTLGRCSASRLAGK